MRIVIITNSSGGLYNFRKELLKKMMDEGHHVIAILPIGKRIRELRKIGIKMVDVEIDRRGKNPISEIKLLLRFFWLLRKQKPDIVVTYTIKPNIYCGIICSVLNIPYAANITGLGTAFQNNGMLRTFVTMMYKVSLKKAKVVFFENCENQQIFIDEKIVPKNKTYLLNGAGVNLEHYCYQEYPTDTDETRFLFVGRVMKEKGVNELFKAMRKLRKDGINCSLDVLGGFEENYEPIIRRFEGEGWLHYHGYQEDVRPFIKNCHCFVLPSWHEGMANTNLECAASGRPVITSNIAGCREAVVEDSGFLCDVKNAISLYEAMKKMYYLTNEERRKMGINGREYMEKRFDKKAVVECTLNNLLRG